jgi:hypothetical protein
MSMGDPEVAQMPGEISAELGSMVSLNTLDRDGQPATKLLDEDGRGADRVVSVDLQDAIPRRLVDGRELVQSAPTQAQMLDIDLNGLACERGGPGRRLGPRR